MSPANRWQGRNDAKDKIRSQVWQRLIDENAVSASPIGRIPAFRLACHAASLLEKQSIWIQAKTIKCNPDTAQIPVRHAVLASSKTLLMAVPQLKTHHCFVMLTQQIVKNAGLSLEKAAIAKHALQIGHPVSFEEMPEIDLVVVGCVAVDRAGGRTGKGAGFADLELGLLQHFGRVSDRTPIVTTVDTRQIIDTALPLEPHDWPLDWIVTADEAMATHSKNPKPKGIDWSHLQMDQWETIPILRKLRQKQLKAELKIRPVKLTDAPQLLTGVNQVIAEQLYLGSAEPFTSDSQRPYLEKVLKNNYPMLIAEHLDKIVGNCDVIPYPELGFRHVGRLGMWVLPQFRGLGIGRSLLAHSLDWAKEHGLEKIELQVYGDNERAISLYQSMGFTLEGKRKKARKLNNQYQDLIYMGLFLNS